ncbi:MAG: L,D-transpeptidase family protein [Chloroflexi bacterium]|nr:L,D-transpeptidase family protein [Chloroflexota bacterium]
MRYLIAFFIGLAATVTLAVAPPVAATPASHVSTGLDPAPRHWVSVDLSEQTLTAYEDEVAIKTFVVSTGDADHPTLRGRYHVKAMWEKIDVIGKDYYFHDVPHFIKYYGSFAIHAATWHDDFGTPVSHGCVNMKPEDAKWVYEFLSVGDLVYIHK